MPAPHLRHHAHQRMRKRLVPGAPQRHRSPLSCSRVRDASDAALADLRRGSERMAEEFAKAYAQAFGQFAT